jgi:hypothetical protein
MNTDRHEAIIAIIARDLRFVASGEDTLANAMRCAASAVLLDFPDATSGEFADAAVDLELHHQASRNRFNEAVKWLKENADLN